jgi:hypothetical protein
MISKTSKQVELVAHMVEIEHTNKVLVTQPQERRPHARQRHSQEENIKIHSKNPFIQNQFIQKPK